MPPEQVASHITAAEAELEIEYQRTKTEAEAFRNFRQKIMDLTPRQPRADGGTTIQRSLTQRTRPRQTSSHKRVCQAYRDTVLSMPHYAEEYNEPLSVHLAAEFGEEVTTSLASNAQLTPPLKKRLIAASQQAARQRVRFLSELDAEATELEVARATLSDLRARLEDQDVDQSHGRSFDELQSRYETLKTTKNRCDTLAETRQQSVHTDNWTSRELANCSPLQSYLYADLDVTYPILADLAEFGRYLQHVREYIEHALAVVY